ncbi:sorting nexin mvp1 [Piedraia hortae CBS 480.64]|uniref:Sorting nexin MVP1 n=1 Tax=Piedraia hortae CBS 480.64 TaxID=1314780 RepID=A0A6A7C8B7_9PEZI|nr:sorting nexin mvp1 [Piedraia hortae CBS 480.64]
MSLFGDTDESDGGPKSSLFANNPPPTTKSTSMFGDTSTDDGPWGFTPTKRSVGNRELIKSLLAEASIPDAYIDRFDQLQTNGSVPAEDCRKLLEDCSLELQQEERVWKLLSDNGNVPTLGRSEFNVLLALIGLAQQGEETSLDGVDERKQNLPVPILPELHKQQQRAATPQRETEAGAPQQRTPQKSSGAFGGLDNDPWASPELHKGHVHNPDGPTRTTSSFTTSGSPSGTYDTTPSHVQSGMNPAWGGPSSYEGDRGLGFGEADGSRHGGGANHTDHRPRASVMNTSREAEEEITVTLLGEKEGMFMFQHRNYEVTSVRRGSKVIRRYSDFVWLLDCLHKRYPFRQLPLLPPKRVAINGNHLAADQAFLERRRRGLVRFMNSLVRHPVLKGEQLVVMFLTVPRELGVWRKQATISVQDEFVSRSLDPALEQSLSPNLTETFDSVRAGVKRSAELYINLCTVTERLCKRKEALAGEYGRFALNLTDLTAISQEAYAIDTNDVPLLNEGVNATVKHVTADRELLGREAQTWEEGLLEDLKTVRDCFVSMREMFERRDKYARNNIPQLERRIQQNEQKLQYIKAKGDAAKPGEAEKVETAIVNDKNSITNQHARGVFIKECIRDEILYFNSAQYRISRMCQDWAQKRLKFAEFRVDNLRALVDAVDSMPTDATN